MECSHVLKRKATAIFCEYFIEALDPSMDIIRTKLRFFLVSMISVTFLLRLHSVEMTLAPVGIFLKNIIYSALRVLFWSHNCGTTWALQ